MERELHETGMRQAQARVDLRARSRRRKAGRPPRPEPADPLRVHVLVDLERSLEAGGHVKCWERFAEVATGVPGLDLTVHFLGEALSVEELSSTVRLISHVPSCSSRKLGLEGMPAATDLALSHRNRRLEEYLEGSDVLHTTDAFFAMARTALRVARRTGIPLVTSVHTDVPRYARIFAAAACRQTPFGAPLGHVLVRWLRVPDICGWIMDRRFRRYILECNCVLHARPEELQVMDGLPSRRVSVLRRGVDSQFFHPHQGDRSRLSEVFGVPPGSFTVLHAGRIDDSKSVMTLAHAVRRLLDEGVPVHLLMVGKGPRTKSIGELLGSAVTLAGVVDQSTLSWIYASSDVLAFPSRTEVFPNVVLESKASGLPVLVSAEGGSARLIAQDGTDGLTLPDEPAAWAKAIGDLRLDPDRLQAMRQRARRSIVDGWPTWEEVLMEDLLPVWRELGKKEAIAAQAPAGAQAQPTFRFVDGA